MKWAKVILGILFVLNFFLPFRSARADIAPPPAPQLGGLQPFSYQPTNVQMVDERVEMAIQSTAQDSRVQVTANFTMYNLGEMPEAMQVAFPLSSFANCRTIGNSYTHYRVSEDSFAATVTGVTVPIEKVITNHPYPECEQMTWAGFDVAFPVRENVIIQVSYLMQSSGVDFMQDLEYILETGAGWAGPIRHGDVIVKFPYPATSENLLPESTPGYQFRENEVVWSFDNLEPTSANNIRISLVSPHIWQEIVILRQGLTENPALPATWLQLAEAYRDVSKTRKDHLRSNDYAQKAIAAYEQGLAANPNSAELYASYAGFKLHNIDPALSRQLTEAEAASVLALLNQSFALEPNNATAQTTLSELRTVAPFVTFTPPPTVTPDSTPTAAVVPLAMEVNGVQKSQDSLSTAIIFGVLFVLVAGIGIDTFWLIKRRRK